MLDSPRTRLPDLARCVRTALGSVIASVIGVGGTLAAQVGPFAHPDGSPHHYLAVPVASPGITWGEANAAAARAGGYLATITAADESAFVFALADRADLWTQDPTTGAWDGPWIGGMQEAGATEPDGGWAWNELEAATFADWNPGQPDDDGSADRAHLGGSPAGRSAQWGDQPASRRLPGYIVEFSGPTVVRTAGLLASDRATLDGYLLFSGLLSHETYLVDPRGRLVQQWRSPYTPGTAIYLRNNGNLLRSGRIDNPQFPIGGLGGIVEEYDWSGTTVWSFRYSSPRVSLHHDVEELPNGNVLMIAWERFTAEEALAAGRDPALLPDGEVWPDKVIEVDAAGRIVWEWRAWDHLIQDFDPTRHNYGDVALHPERVDLNYAIRDGEADWMHTNAIDYDAYRDQIMLSVRSFDELWIIDHSTTTREAAGRTGGTSGHGGDLLYRWGNPRTYRAGTAADQRLFKQHDAQWIPEWMPGAGNVLVFNNGTDRPGGDASTVDEIVLPTPDAQGNYPRAGAAFGPTDPAWSFAWSPPTGLYSEFVSGAQRLPSGNTMVCAGWIGAIFEVTPQGDVVWRYRVPLTAGMPALQGGALSANGVFRAPLYPPDFPGLAGRSLAAADPIETYSAVLLADGSTVPRQARIGETVDLSIQAGAENAGLPYITLTSLTPGILRLDQRFLRVGNDPLLLVAITSSAPAMFQNYIALLDAEGRGRAALAIPPFPGLTGLEFQTAFLVVDPNARSGVSFFSNTVVVEIVD